MRTAAKKLPRVTALLMALLLLAAFLPTVGARAASASVQMQYGFDLQTALSKATSNGTSPAYADIDTLYIAGNGTLTAADGSYLKATLPNLTSLDLTGYEGEYEAEAFAENTVLKRLVLPEGVKLSRRMFFACTSLEDVVWPRRYTLANDCFSYCALDFSAGYPGLLSDANVRTYAAFQRPVAYMSLPNGSEGTISAGEGFADALALVTRMGSDYRALAEAKPAWLVTLPSDLELTRTVLRDGERVDKLDTSEPGIYTLIYSLPSSTPSDQQSVTYTLTVMTAEGGLPLALTGLPGEVRVGEAFSLGCASDSAEDADCWSWDTNFFEAKFESPATFLPLKAGTTTIAFTGPSGEIGEVDVTVLPAISTDDTGTAGDSLRWILSVSIFIAVVAVAIVIGLLLRQRQAKKKPAGAKASGAPPAPAVTTPPKTHLDKVLAAEAEEAAAAQESTAAEEPVNAEEPVITEENAAAEETAGEAAAEPAPEDTSTSEAALPPSAVAPAAGSAASGARTTSGKGKKKRKGKKKGNKPQNGAAGPVSGG